MNKTQKTNQLAVIDERALVPTNPSVQKIAKRLHWRPSTAVTRIQMALPAPFEQQIYLSIAGHFGILPESMAKLLRLFLGHSELQPDDLNPRFVGRDLVHSRLDLFTEFLRECLNLLKIIKHEYTAFSLSIEQAGWIVLHYGPDDPEILIEMVDTNLEALCDALGVSNYHAYSHRMRLCLWLVVSKVIPDNRKRGMVDVLDVTGFLEMSSVRRHQLRMTLSQQVPDYLSADWGELRGYNGFGLLREEGII